MFAWFGKSNEMKFLFALVVVVIVYIMQVFGWILHWGFTHPVKLVILSSVVRLHTYIRKIVDGKLNEVLRNESQIELNQINYSMRKDVYTFDVDISAICILDDEPTSDISLFVLGVVLCNFIRSINGRFFFVYLYLIQ